MKPELEALLKLLDAYFEADPAEADAAYERYQIKLQESSNATRIATETLDLAVRKKYPRWCRATSPRHPTLPPRA
jgi:hypothetical protein